MWNRTLQLAKLAYDRRAALAEVAAADTAVGADGGEGGENPPEEEVEPTESELQAGMAAADGKPVPPDAVSPRALQAALAVITKPQYETWSPEDYVVKIVDFGNACWVERKRQEGPRGGYGRHLGGWRRPPGTRC